MFLLLAKDANLDWKDECQQAFDFINEKLTNAPILQGSTWELSFHIHTDASDKVIGEVWDKQEEKEPCAIYYINKNLVGDELNYMLTEKEFLSMVYAINKFKHYITRYIMYIHINHYAIRYFMNKYDVNTRIIRWILLLQELDITILDKSNKHNVVVDFLSKLTHDVDRDLVDDAFLNENLFSISV